MLNAVYHPCYLKSMLFPYEEGIRSADIKKTLQEIASTMSVIFYTHDEKEYYALKSWGKFQTINKPTPSSVPAPVSDYSAATVVLPEDYGSTTVALPPKRKEEEKEKKEEEKGKKSSAGKPPARFIPPTVEEVAAYCKKRGRGIDPEACVDYYQANGWIQGKG